MSNNKYQKTGYFLFHKPSGSFVSIRKKENAFRIHREANIPRQLFDIVSEAEAALDYILEAASWKFDEDELEVGHMRLHIRAEPG